MNEPYIFDLYDRICKRCISFSRKGTIFLINGLYGRDYPLDSSVEYNWTEHEDDNLKKTLADSIITINHRDSYHIEIQMYPDSRIVMRVFEYGFHHALKSQSDAAVLNFPNPMILYLYEDGGVDEYQCLTINFGTQGTFKYRVPAFRYLRMNRTELERRKLIVLIPFQLLRLRKAIEKERTAENLKALKTLVQNDIIDVINNNIAVGNLTPMEGQTLKQMTLWLYRRIYGGYAEMEEEGVNTMVEDELILDMDIVVAEERKKARAWALEHVEEWTKERMEVLENRNNAVISEKDAVISEKDIALSERDTIIKSMFGKLRSLGLSDEEILKTSGMTSEQFQKIESGV